MTKDITSVEYYDTVFALAESPLKKDMIWAGTDDGLIQFDDRRRPALGQRHAERYSGMEHGQHH